MSAGFITLEMALFGLVFWLGLYLVSRDLKNLRLCLIGGGLTAYALGISCGILNKYTVVAPSILWIAHLSWLLFSFFLAFPTGLLQFFLPGDAPSAPSPSSLALQKIRRFYLYPLLVFAPGIGLLLFPLPEPVHASLVLFVGLDLLLFGLAAATLDAFNRGEALLPDIFRSFDYSLIIALLFGSQVLLFMFLGTGITFFTLLLLMTILATAVATQVFSDQVVTWLDKIAFAYFPWLKKARAELRTTASTLPRINQDLVPENIDDTDFTRFTRRALSNFGDLARLATNPLTNLPMIETRLCAQNRKIDTLERATELKVVLTECIARLKPRGDDAFGTSDEWRYYNALYFPYVTGLKPYSQRTQHIPSDPVSRKALEWFRTQVPERTLYNWQNAATRLIVQDLRSHDTQQPDSVHKAKQLR